MAPEQTSTSGHLKLCREVYSELRRIQAHQGHNGSSVTADLPFNLSIFLGHFAGYIKWAERNAKVVEIASRMPPIRVGQHGDIA
jgi:hypothetical protein